MSCILIGGVWRESEDEEGIKAFIPEFPISVISLPGLYRQTPLIHAQPVGRLYFTVLHVLGHLVLPTRPVRRV